MKAILKSLADVVALVLVSPALLAYGLGTLLLGRDKAFPGWSQALSLLPGLTGVTLRRAFYRVTLKRCSTDCCLSFGTIFASPDAEIGRGVYTGANCILGAVTLEDDVLLGSCVSVMNGPNQHGIARLDVPIREQPGSPVRVTVGRDSWIGERAIVLADVGRHCVIGAGSVVTRPIPDYAIAVGSPARILRTRDGAPVTDGQEVKPT